MKLQNQSALASQDPPFMTNREQLDKLDSNFELFTTVNLKSDKIMETEGEHLKIEDMYSYLISQIPEFQTRQN